ncbi:DUF3099 domain-containing protein [Arthrobacter gandavensis]|nr:DUF3099 domain-containing protein [Arthrobacter gandavensis]
MPRITDARSAHTDEMHARMVKYTVSMSIRMVCLFLLFFVHGWMLWVVVAGAVVLPWFAVVIANGGSDSSNLGGDSPYEAPAPQQLEARVSDAPESPGTTVLSGEIIDDDGPSGHGTQAPKA